VEHQCKGIDLIILLTQLNEHIHIVTSAAKAPYRATFRVQNVGIEQVEHCADPDYELMQDLSNQYSQMAIFKVGDDVRQVEYLSC
jgi:hypothetical protein